MPLFKSHKITPEGEIQFRWICKLIGHDFREFHFDENVRMICVRCGKEILKGE